MVRPATDTASGGGEISTKKPETPFTTEDYAGIESFDDAMALVEQKMGGVVIDSIDLGDGFSVVENKDTLLGTPLLILAVHFSEGDHGEFASCRAVTEDGRKVVINDGSTGIFAQLKLLQEKRPEIFGAPIMCRNGLRKSEYDHPEHGRSVTYYLDTSGKRAG